MSRRVTKKKSRKKSRIISRRRRSQSRCPPGKVRNPSTGRCIKDKRSMRRRRSQSRCPPGKVRNPSSGRCIKDKTIVVLKPKCKNSNTYIYQYDADTLDEKDLIKIDGYCFSISEIIEWIDSGTFNNINPHDLNKTKLFKNFKNISNTELRKKLENWLQQKIQADLNIANYMINNKRDILLYIGYSGITCLYDNASSHEKNDSGTFEESIEVLGKLSNYMRDDDIIANLKISENYTLKNLINDANSGNTCIHGIGFFLLELFFDLISKIQNTNKNVKILSIEDFVKLNFFLVKDKRKNIVLFKIDNRLVHDSNSVYYRTNFDFLYKIPNIESLVTPIDEIDNIISSIFTRQCQNTPELVTNDSVENWKDIPIWRRIKTSDSYCFDLLFLIKILGINLDNSIAANPYPIYPKNIFTNKRLTNIDLLNIKRRIINNNIDIYNGSLKLFLNSPELWSEDDNYINSNTWRERVIRLFETKLRFIRYFDKMDIDNDGNRIAIIAGFWDDKNTPTDVIETYCLRYLDTLNINFVSNLSHKTVPYYNISLNISPKIDNSNTNLFF